MTHGGCDLRQSGSREPTGVNSLPSLTFENSGASVSRPRRGSGLRGEEASVDIATHMNHNFVRIFFLNFGHSDAGAPSSSNLGTVMLLACTWELREQKSAQLWKFYRMQSNIFSRNSSSELTQITSSLPPSSKPTISAVDMPSSSSDAISSVLTSNASIESRQALMPSSASCPSRTYFVRS